ncbi:ankyrin-1-like [Leptopilina boulardi]|uniref:ankyrin-1-like n=1 Tax=Leptopilina boulardi TaxID=63433 RepID=UPI0021F52819|nr:ankyrin-1-like [Leptopilina boulardi]XP_051158716.1 ankyrin-1-like [Leptopilina boulardi]
MNELINQLLCDALREHNIEAAKSIINEISLSLFETWDRGFNFLCYALRDKQFEIAELLIKNGCKLRLNNNQTTALHVAILNANLEIIKLIHKKIWKENNTCNLLDEDEDGKNVFHLFMYRTPVDDECRRILRYLLKNCPITVTSTITNLSPIHYAAKYGNTQMIRLLLLIDKNQVNNTTKYMKYTPLHFATERGHMDVIYLLLENLAKVNAKTINNESALSLAVKLRLQPIVQILLKYYNENLNSLKEEKMLIYNAVMSREICMLEFFLIQGLDPNIIEEKSKMTPLLLAIEQNCLNSVILLLNYGANLKIIHSIDGYSVLHFAIKNIEIFTYLLKIGANINIHDLNKQNPLHIATKLENLHLINEILNNCDILSLFTLDFIGMTPLHIAVNNGNKNIIKLFLNKGVPIDLKTKTKLSSMHLAAKKGSLSLVKILQNYEANLHISGSMTMETPLFYAALSGNLKLVKYLHKTKKISNQWLEDYVALYAASYNGHVEIVLFLLEQGVDPNICYRNFLSPLHAAAQRGHKLIVNLLIEAGALVNNNNNNNSLISTPFLAAISNGHEEIALIIQQHGANINVKLKSAIFELENNNEFESLLICGYETRLKFHEQLKLDYTGIFFAILSGNINLVKYLIKNGANINVTTKSGETPILLAIKNQFVDIVSYLLKSGANINSENSPLLFHAISLNNYPIVELLLNKGHSIDYIGNYGNQDGYTVMHLAIKGNNINIVDALLKKNFDLDTCTEKDYLLHYAIDKNNEDIIIKLIENGASLDSTCFKGLNPLLHALLAGNIKIFMLLIKNGATLNERSILGKNLLHFALDNLLNENVIKFLIEIGINVNEKNEFLLSLIERIIYDQAEKIEILNARYSQLLINELNDRINLEEILEHPSDNWNDIVEPRNESDKICDDTFNGMVIKRGFYNTDRILAYFLEYGLDVNTIIDIQQRTILHYSCICSNAEAVRMLILHNADFNVIDKRGRTAFCYAVEHSMWAWTAFHQECCSDVYNEEEEKLISPDLHWNDYDDFERYSQRTSEIKLKKILRNRNAFKEIARLMTKGLVKIEAAGNEIHWENKELLESGTVHIYYNLCKVEIESLKRTQITRKISFFQLLIADEITLTKYARNKIIQYVMAANNIDHLFPYYGKELIFRYNIGIQRNNLIIIAGYYLSQAINISIPILVQELIFKELNLNELKNLCRIIEPFYFVRDDDDDESDED